MSKAQRTAENCTLKNKHRKAAAAAAAAG